jgi:hypothetical protein
LGIEALIKGFHLWGFSHSTMAIEQVLIGKFALHSLTTDSNLQFANLQFSQNVSHY